MYMGRIEGSRILVTGGTGSIGSEVVRQLLKRSPAHITILSRDDSKQFYLKDELSQRNDVTFIIGDVRDRESLHRAFRGGVDIVVHAAALKHVEICEINPTESVKTNILGTQNVVDLSTSHGVKHLVTISTDKAVNPTNTMGATKYLAEKITLDSNSKSNIKSLCVRFGNVLSSRGSVIPSMVKGMKKNGKIWISDGGVTRFAIPIDESASLVLDALEMSEGGEIFVLKMKAFSLDQLVRVMLSLDLYEGEVMIEKRGLTQGEKLHEDLVSDDELPRLWESENHYVIMPHNYNPQTSSNLSKSEKELYNSGSESMFSDDEIRNEILRYVNEP
jgi:FlaA1/EpsC-like NDP-sugar epimerase